MQDSLPHYAGTLQISISIYLQVTSRTGRKHRFENGIEMNEDGHGVFAFEIGRYRCMSFWIADGHGEIDKPSHDANKPQRFIQILNQKIPIVIKEYVHYYIG
jgi:hypothetical protein